MSWGGDHLLTITLLLAATMLTRHWYIYHGALAQIPPRPFHLPYSLPRTWKKFYSPHDAFFEETNRRPLCACFVKHQKHAPFSIADAVIDSRVNPRLPLPVETFPTTEGPTGYDHPSQPLLLQTTLPHG